jgi:hypothetical protein
VGNNADTDDDGDGYDDLTDRFPLDPNEWVDTDGDGVGNNADADDDGDGYDDATDRFPLDPTEWLDTDGDGIGDNADTPFNAGALLSTFNQLLTTIAAERNGAPIDKAASAAETRLPDSSGQRQ